MKVAVVGTGIAGNVAAWKLSQQHQVTVFEADQRIGGHSHTVDVELDGRHFAVDTGFIVFNDRTYPNFVELLDQLGVASRPTEMSFSVRDDRANLEYNGTSLNALFAQRGNLARPAFWKMIADILRFHREAPAVLAADAEDMALDEWLARGAYGTTFRNRYILPMGSAIWSSSRDEIGRMPVRFFVRFFNNHGLLSVRNRPTWRVIEGGSRNYVDPLVAGHRDRIRLGAPVQAVRRLPGQVMVKARGCEAETFDHVFLACHSDQALAMLQDPSRAEREVLGAIPYRRNEAVLHTDSAVLPRRRLAWAAWNYHLDSDPDRPAAVTYNMNILQHLRAPEAVCVSLNHTQAIDESRVLGAWHYAHPVLGPASIAAQARHQEINQGRRTSFCGAYWRNGFHEDGVVSALDAVRHFEQDPAHVERDLQRTG
ncbi:NAD(P)-binding protein [Marinihelvus fidelis]|uniref:NAD(P)-binding protein n=1 Tax=Marinihelvus fidelis TaxID=2613842 RepID=A0A5N0TGH5_9GAMM|nr:FAD-dependent oxidoreductase [Marinihelvus fidelis]KAA9134195.1 NAD(P)-binding protein [Marinihelvus fidelis]